MIGKSWLLVLLCWQVTGAAPVVLISIDGLRPDYVLQSDWRLPHLRNFLQQGSYATGVRAVAPTLTYPCHTTLLTGVTPAKHGILSNKTFDPQAKNQKGWYWYASDIRVPTLWEAVTATGHTALSVHWPVSVAAPVTWNLPQYWRSGLPDDRKLLRALATPGLLEELEPELGPYADGINELIAGDTNRARFMARLLERKRPDFATFYFAALDHEQHASGPHSRESRATLERLDEVLGVLLATIERVYAGQAVVCVVSDHGFTPSRRAFNLGVALREAGFIECNDSGQVLSWKAAAWDAGGCFAVMVPDPQDRPGVGQLLDELARDPENGIVSVLAPAELSRAGAFPEAAFVVTLAPDFYADTRLFGDLTTPAEDKGMHGHWPDLPAMNSALFLRGPGIPAGRSLGLVDMRAVAPTLARLLGVPLPGAESKPCELR